MKRAEVESIFEQEKELLFKEIEPSEKPLAIILGGQPASGKSKLTDIAESEHDGRKFLSVNGDLYRAYHPEYGNLIKNAQKYSSDTQIFSNVFTEKLIDEAIKRKCDIIIEGTMRNPNVPKMTANLFRKEGYKVEAYAIAAPDVITRLGIYLRFQEEVNRKSVGRLAEIEPHDAAVIGLPKSLDLLFKEKLVDRISIHSYLAKEKIKDFLLSDNLWNYKFHLLFLLTMQEKGDIEKRRKGLQRTNKPASCKILQENVWYDSERIQKQQAKMQLLKQQINHKTMKIRNWLTIMTSLLLFFCSNIKGEETIVESGKTTTRTEWFEQARLGMFIHWSAGAVDGARFQGEKLRNPVPYGEWLRCRNRVPREEYDKLISKMTFTQEEADRWAETAHNAGMKYLLFVAKHHDGLAYWPSDVSDYTFDKLTGLDIDVCDMVAKACKKYGLKLGFYYSQWQDWEHPYGFGNFWDYENDASLLPRGDEWLDKVNNGVLFRPTLAKENYLKYWREKSLPQVKELINRYNPEILWFDMYCPRELSNMTEKECRELLDLVREESPSCIVNTRLGISEVGENGVDFQTLGDNQLGFEFKNHPWESSVTLNHSWGYNRDDLDYKTPRFFIESLVSNIAMGGNLQINIGPKADGTITREAENTFSEIGLCIKGNRGKGFYNNTYAGFEKESQDWGLITKERGEKNKIYLHVFEWPLDGIIRVNGLRNKIQQITLAATGEKLEHLDWGYTKHIQVPNKQSVAYDVVLEVEFEGNIEIDNSMLGEINNGGYYLPAKKASLQSSKLMSPLQGGWIPEHVNVHEKDTISWNFRNAKESIRKFFVCYSSTKSDGEYTLFINDEKISTNSVNQTHTDNWEYRTYNCGQVHLKQDKIYEVKLIVEKSKNMNFHLAHVFIE